ncbi:MAG: PPE family protein [Mycobacterium sp.]
MNFATLPPEINSGRMYEGPGSGSMTETVTAWDRLAARLYTAAADYRAVTSKLVAGWENPASTALNEAVAPYVDWLYATAAQAELAAIQAAAAANAHETALAEMVPPPLIDANRTQRTSLASANCLGQSSPAIADTEAEYERMWAQNVAAMHSYAKASADACTVTPFASPRPHTTGPAHRGTRGTWSVTAAPQIISAGSPVISTIPEALQALSLSPLTTFDASLSPVTSSLSKLSSLSAPSGFAISHLNSLNKAAALRWLLPNQGGARGAVITAGFGRGTSIGTSIGTLSVPRAWTTAATPMPVCGGAVAQGLGDGQRGVT